MLQREMQPLFNSKMGRELVVSQCLGIIDRSRASSAALLLCIHMFSRMVVFQYISFWSYLLWFYFNQLCKNKNKLILQFGGVISWYVLLSTLNKPFFQQLVSHLNSLALSCSNSVTYYLIHLKISHFISPYLAAGSDKCLSSWQQINVPRWHAQYMHAQTRTPSARACMTPPPSNQYSVSDATGVQGNHSHN